MLAPWQRTEWTLEDWLEHAWQLENEPRSSAPQYAACARHAFRFPFDLISVELDRGTLESLRRLIMYGRRLGRPGVGYRAEHWTTPALMATNNQLQRLDRARGINSRAAA